MRARWSRCTAPTTASTPACWSSASRRHAFIVEEEAICYLLPVDELIDLTANNKAFAEFFFRDISLKLDALAARQTIRELQPVMMAQVRDAYIHPPLYVDTAHLGRTRRPA